MKNKNNNNNTISKVVSIVMQCSEYKSLFVVLSFSESYKVQRGNSMKGPELIKISSAIFRNQKTNQQLSRRIMRAKNNLSLCFQAYAYEFDGEFVKSIYSCSLLQSLSSLIMNLIIMRTFLHVFIHLVSITCPLHYSKTFSTPESVFKLFSPPINQQLQQHSFQCNLKVNQQRHETFMSFLISKHHVYLVALSADICS